jgi:hypothetical protein
MATPKGNQGQMATPNGNQGPMATPNGYPQVEIIDHVELMDRLLHNVSFHYFYLHYVSK